MKKYIILSLILLVVILFTSCELDPGEIETQEDAALASDIVFNATSSGMMMGCTGIITETDCYITPLIDGGSIEFCIGDVVVISNSIFYNELDLENGFVMSTIFNDAHVPYYTPGGETSEEYILNGSIGIYVCADYQGTNPEIVSVIYGSVDIQGDDISDTAEFDVKYTYSVNFEDSQNIISGTVEGTVNGIDVSDDDAWK
jgi:hypothetical protein